MTGNAAIEIRTDTAFDLSGFYRNSSRCIPCIKGLSARHGHLFYHHEGPDRISEKRPLTSKDIPDRLLAFGVTVKVIKLFEQ